MPHFRVDDALHSHPKAIKAGDAALGLWVRAGSYCMAYLTDGFIPEWWIRKQRRGNANAKRLVECGLWSEFVHENEPGYLFHEFTGPGRQDSREKIEADRQTARQRQESWRLSRRDKQRDSSCDITDLSRRDKHRESRKTPGYYPTQPNPTQPNPLSMVDLGGELTQVGPHCPRHPNGTMDPCGACADARRAYEANQADELEARRRVGRQLREAITACPDCDDSGMVDLSDDTVTKCDHLGALHA